MRKPIPIASLEDQRAKLRKQVEDLRCNFAWMRYNLENLERSKMHCDLKSGCDKLCNLDDCIFVQIRNSVAPPVQAAKKGSGDFCICGESNYTVDGITCLICKLPLCG